MAIFSERTNASILDFAVDLEGEALFVSKINGDPALIGQPIPLSVGGSVTIGSDGIAVYDDQGLSSLPEGARRYDSVIVAISDGVNEVETAISLEIFGQDVSSAIPVDFGAATRAEAGGVPVDGSTITGGNTLGHWKILNGHLVPTHAGQGALEESYLLSFDSGTPMLVTIIPDRLDVRDGDELSVAATAAEALNPATDHDVVIRDGVMIGDADTPLEITDIRMGGVLADPNAALGNFGYDTSARSQFGGGSLTIRAETAGAAGFAGPLVLTGCDGVCLSGLAFATVANESAPESYDYGAGNAYAGPADSLYQLELEGGADGHRGVVLVEDSSFAAPEDRAAGHWARGVKVGAIATAHLQDNSFARLRAGIDGGDTDRLVSIRNAYATMIGDALGVTGTDAARPTLRVEMTAGTIFPPADAEMFSGVTAGAARLDGVTEIDVFLHQNYIYAPVPARTGGGTSQIRSSAGFIAEGGPITGEISHNIILASGPLGIALDAAEFVTVSNNTLIPDTQTSPLNPDYPAMHFGSEASSIITQRNVIAALSIIPGAGVAQLSNYIYLDPTIETGAASFAEIFTGTFGFAAGTGPTYDIDITDVLSLRSDLDALFDTSPDGEAAGLGFRRIGIPRIEGFPEVGQTLTVAGASAAASYIWRRNGIDISGANGPSYTVQAADDGTDLTVVRTEAAQFIVSVAVRVRDMFKIAGASLTGPDGAAFRPKGFNLFAGHYPFRSWEMEGLINGDGGFTSAGQDALEAWGVNTIRVNILSEGAFTFTLVGEAGTVRTSAAVTSIGGLIHAATSIGIITILNFTGWDGASFAQINGSSDINPTPDSPSASTAAMVTARMTHFAQTYRTNPYVWFEPYNARGTAADWRDIHQPVIDAIRETGNMNPVLVNAPYGGQDLETETSDIASSLVLAEGGAFSGSNIGFDVHLGERFHQKDSAALSSYLSAFAAAGLWVISGNIGGINAGESIGQTRHFVAERALAADPDLSAVIWHGGLAAYPTTTSASGDPTGIDNTINPGNLTPAGNLFWRDLFGRDDQDVRAPKLHINAIRSLNDGAHEVTLSTDTGGGLIRAVGQDHSRLPTSAEITAGQDADGTAAIWGLTEVAAPTGPGTVTLTIPAGSVSHIAAYQIQDVSGALDGNTSSIACRDLIEGGLLLAVDGAGGTLTLTLETFAAAQTVYYAAVDPGTVLDADAIRAAATAGNDAGSVTINTASVVTETLAGLSAADKTIFAVLGTSNIIAIAQHAELQIDAQIVHFGAETLAGAGAYTFTPEEGDIASIGSLSGASGFTASIQDGVVSIMPAQDGLVPGSYTLSLPTYSSTGGEVVVSFQVTVVADDFSVATAGELEAAYSIGNGKSVTLRPGRYVNFQRETNSVERTTAFRGRRFPAGITIRSDSVAQGLFDFDVQRPVIEMTVGSLDLGDTSNITFDGLEFYMPSAGNNIFSSLIQYRNTAQNLSLIRCWLHSDEITPAEWPDWASDYGEWDQNTVYNVGDVIRLPASAFRFQSKINNNIGNTVYTASAWQSIGSEPMKFSRPNLLGTDGTPKSVGLTLIDTIFSDGNNAIFATPEGDIRIEGCMFTRLYADDMKIETRSPSQPVRSVEIRRNRFTAKVGDPQDSGNPHADVLQFVGPDDPPYVDFDGQFIFEDNDVDPLLEGRGDVQGIHSGDFTTFHNPIVRRNRIVVNLTNGLQFDGIVVGAVIEDNLVVHTDTFQDTFRPQIIIGGDPNLGNGTGQIQGTIILRGNACGRITLGPNTGATVIDENNYEYQITSDTIEDAFVGPFPATSTATSHAAFEPKPGGPLYSGGTVVSGYHGKGYVLGSLFPQSGWTP